MVHVCLSRHTIELARIGCATEVWAGHVPAITPRLTEDFGARASAFKFMDHRGTRFHEDRRDFRALRLYPPQACVICDNVVHPGAPEFLWSERADPSHRCYSLQEFAQQDLEDWQSFHGAISED